MPWAARSLLTRRGDAFQPDRSDRLAPVDIARATADLEHDVLAGGLLPVRELFRAGGVPSLQEAAECGEALVPGQLFAVGQVELAELGEHRGCALGLVLVIASQGIARVVPAEERFQAAPGTAPAVGDEFQPAGSACPSRCDRGCRRARQASRRARAPPEKWTFSRLNPNSATPWSGSASSRR